MPRRLAVKVAGSVALYHGVPDVDRVASANPNISESLAGSPVAEWLLVGRSAVCD
jgi:hypothetical protein